MATTRLEMRLAGGTRESVPMAERAIGAAVALLLLAGLGGFSLALFGFAPDAALLAASAVAGIAAIAVCAFLHGRGRIERIGYLVALAVAVVVCLVLHAPLLEGGAQALNGLLVHIGERTQVYPAPYAEASAPSLMLFCVVYGALAGFASALTAFRGGVVLALVLSAGMALAVAAGLAPAGAWIALWALGVAGCLLSKTLQSGHARGPGALVSGFAAVALAAIIIGAAAFAGARSPEVDTSAARGAVEQAWYTLRYGADAYAMPQGQLDGLGALKASDQPALTVSTDAPMLDYLRGYVGERYEDGAWGPLPSSAVTGESALFYWLDEDGFSAASQLADAATAAGYDGGGEAGLSIEVEAARGGYAYLPYGYAAGASYDETTDLSSTIALPAEAAADEGEGALEYEPDLMKRAYLLQKALEEASVGAQVGTYLDDEGAYRAFVYENYTTLPQDAADTFEQLYGPSVALTTEQAKVVVKAEIDQTIAYDVDYETDNGDEDFVVHLLTESQTGYSVHYATAAALLLRYYGIPARYAEGYLVDTEQMEGDGQGTYVLTEANAHAWAEYYLDGVGWIPFETTPGYAGAMQYEPTSDTELEDEAISWSAGALDSSSSWKPQDIEEDTESDADESESALNGVPPIDWLWFVIGVLCGIAAVGALRTLLFHRRLAREIEALSSSDADMSAATGRLFAYGVYLQERCGGVTFGNVPFSAQAENAGRAGIVSAETFAAAAAANDRALFSEGGAQASDRDAALRLVEEARDGLRARQGRLRTFLQRHIQCLW